VYAERQYTVADTKGSDRSDFLRALGPLRYLRVTLWMPSWILLALHRQQRDIVERRGPGGMGIQGGLDGCQ
jgi:hypothetical protein